MGIWPFTSPTEEVVQAADSLVDLISVFLLVLTASAHPSPSIVKEMGAEENGKYREELLHPHFLLLHSPSPSSFSIPKRKKNRG